MGRDELYITVPSFFRCPISLDVMTSPVSLSTGVTYDRSSIQRWLDTGNNTCPATMQLARFAAESDDNCIFLAKIDGFAELLLNLMTCADDDEPEEKNLKTMELMFRIYESVLAKSEDRQNLINSAFDRNLHRRSSLQLVIERGKIESKISSLKILESVAITEESKLVIAETEGFLRRLLKFVSPAEEAEVNLIDSTLSCLIHLAGPKRVRTRLLHLGAIKSLSDLLAASPSPAVSVIEKALKLLETVSSCREGREALSGDDRCVEAVLQRAFKVSAVATEHAVAILWSLCYAAGDERPRAVVRRCNGVARLLVVMQSGCSPAVRRMCGELLRIFRVSSQSQPCLSNYETKTTHIMPF
ncbi:hypothetical protein CRG98_037380 [Punica granatum]|uniref:U-box domain-containing protein n=1 Tax=Punica granatum TaxID=22663 RepID=A0A2I0IE27_PUNGR|nr:hypothetical protein CRG98_037380 [Punica granatum]